LIKAILFHTQLIDKKSILKLSLLSILIAVFIYQFINSINANVVILDTSNFTTEILDDEITPYCNGVNYSINGYSFNSIETLDIEIHDSRKWYKDLIDIYLRSSKTGDTIDPEFKERFNSTIKVKFNQNFECSFEARIRVSGDFLDHIDYGHEPKASLDVHLDNGNILGITKFKLFLEEARGSDGGENEVLVSSILRNIGYIAPRTAILPVILNGSKSSNYIFQEKASKEMIEFHGFREGPILETNEKYLFEFEDFSTEVFDDDRNYFFSGKVLNGKWFKANTQNLDIGTEALQLYNQAIYSSYDPNNQLNYESLNTNTLDLYLYDALNFALNSKHGIINHNRKFYYDKISETFIPIYYDGNSGFLSEPVIDLWPNYKKTKELSKAAAYFLENHTFDIQKMIKELNYYRLNYEEGEMRTIVNNLQNNLIKVTKFSESEYSKKNINENLLNAENHNVDFLILEGMKYKTCSQYLTNCSDFEVAKDLTSLLDVIDRPKNLIFGNNLDKTYSSINRASYISSREVYELGTNIILNSFYSPIISIDREKKSVDIFINKVNQKVLINGDGILDNWQISINSSVKDQLSSRQDSLLLTGCLTLANIDIKNIIISAENQHCEDAVNLIRTSGTISSLIIKNSLNDGFDADYSTLDVEIVNIMNSGNDCTDLSGGFYTLKLINLYGCVDKGISIGENSQVIIDDTYISETKIAVAVKDSSQVIIQNIDSQNVEICIAMYRKKQEFGPSYGLIKQNMCDSNSINFIQKGSYYDG